MTRSLGPVPGRLFLLASAAALLLVPGHAAAQADPDFLFQRPRLRLGLQGGYALPRAGSEIFDFTSERLTVEEGDFDAFSLGVEAAYRATERLDLVLGLGYSEETVASEFRDWVDTDDRPIEQATSFARRPVMFGVRAYLRDRGRSVSRYAWVPGSWSPFVTGGGGWIWYRFEQEGDFVDFETLDVFPDRFTSRGASPGAYLGAGLDVSLGPRFVLTGEGRYLWGSAEMDRDFQGFDEIDLAGFQATLGISARF